MPSRSQTTAAAALMAFVSGVNSHMIMASPSPFGLNKGLTNSPLTSGNFPCQVSSDAASFYSKDGIDMSKNTMAVGETQTLSFTGSAVHGGGSCQLAITTDKQPSASTSWQVIMSIEGGCPSKDGNGPSTYDYKIPDGFAPGDYVFAWTWISKMSGTQEYYMNCAPIVVTGGNSKRSFRTVSSDELLGRSTFNGPELMVSNLADINSCKSELSTDPTYPSPGDNVVKPNSNAVYKPITGSDCVPKGLKDSSGSSSGGDAPASSAGGSDSSSVAATSSATATSAAATSAASGFITSTVAASSSASPMPTSSAAASYSSAPAQTSSMAPTSVASAPAGSSSSPAGSGSNTTGLTGSCDNEGMFNCIGGTSYQQCASGSWSAMMQMPATTTCKEGQTMTLWARNVVDKRGGAFRARRGLN